VTKKKIKAISLFSGAGIDELLLNETSIEIVVANELISKRAECYSYFYPDTEMICGDITNSIVKKKIIDRAKSKGAVMLIATPPCQGLSTLGKNKNQTHYESDGRNFLILETFSVIDDCNFDYILFENVPRFLDMYFPYGGKYLHIVDILGIKYSNKYNIEADVLDAKDYGICQTRPRVFIRMYKKGLRWMLPEKEKEIPLFKAIGHLPSLEAGEASGIPWHFAKTHNERAILALRHTAPGKSAIYNEIYYPKKPDGSRIKGFHNTFKRMMWEQPCPARTTFCGSISSHNNVHPGRPLNDGTYSDARVLTLLETFIVSSVPPNISFPEGSSDTFIRTIVGEAVPPKLMAKVLRGIVIKNGNNR